MRSLFFTFGMVEIIEKQVHSNFMRKLERKKSSQNVLPSDKWYRFQKYIYQHGRFCVCGTSLIYVDIKTKLRCVLLNKVTIN